MFVWFMMSYEWKHGVIFKKCFLKSSDRFISFKDLIYFILFYVYKYIDCLFNVHYMHALCPQRPVEYIGSTGTGVTEGCEQPRGFWELNPEPSSPAPQSFNCTAFLLGCEIPSMLEYESLPDIHAVDIFWVCDSLFIFLPAFCCCCLERALSFNFSVLWSLMSQFFFSWLVSFSASHKNFLIFFWRTAQFWRHEIHVKIYRYPVIVGLFVEKLYFPDWLTLVSLLPICWVSGNVLTSGSLWRCMPFLVQHGHSAHRNVDPETQFFLALLKLFQALYIFLYILKSA